ncbi:MAG TPA: DUF1326 domain-containing protein [Ideonella sp.]|nr:DUF1326 domain-containing protein [Ideonella sp.]
MAQWKLGGTYFETCNCEVGCPCVFTSAPSHGDCTVVVAWHVDRGSFDHTPLDGLNVALAVRTPGHMLQTKWTAAVYVDEQAKDAQKDALLTIFSGKAGGHPAVLASFVGEILGAKSVPMRYHNDGKRASLDVANVISAEIEAIEGQGGGPVTIAGHPLCIAPGQAATVARSKSFGFTDYGMNWQLSGRNGFMSPFSYASG